MSAAPPRLPSPLPPPLPQPNPSTIPPRPRRAVSALRCLAAGLFIYMAFFELMPPFPHGQLNNLKYFAAFCVGMSGAYLGDLIEDSVHAMGWRD